MQIKKIYISDDGEEFETEEECLEYEKIVSSRDSVILFDYCEGIINDDDFWNAFDQAIYIYITDAERAEKFLQWVKESTDHPVPENVKTGWLYY